MRRGLHYQHIKDEVFTAGQSVSMQVTGKMPPKTRVWAVVFDLLSDITQPGAGQAAQLGTVLPQLISQLVIGRRIAMSGLALKFHEWMKVGKYTGHTAGFPATAGGVFSREQRWTLWLADPSGLSPGDGAVPSELFQDDLQVRFGTTSIFAPTVPTSVGNSIFRAGLLYDADSDPDDARVVPQSRIIKSVNKADLAPVINQVGAFPYAGIFREASNDAGGITSAQISALNAFVDGEAVRTDARLYDLVAEFNRDRAVGTETLVESQTAPSAPEMIQQDPGYAAAAGQALTADFAPFLWPTIKYKMSQVARATLGINLTITGTLGSYTIFYEALEALTEDMVTRAANKLMPGKAFQYRPKTLSKSNLNANALARFLPVRLQASKPTTARGIAVRR